MDTPNQQTDSDNTAHSGETASRVATPKPVDITTWIQKWPHGSNIGVSSATEILATGGDINASEHIASVTKLFSTYAVLVALEEGTVALDDPAGPDGATLGHLLSHSSGLGFTEDDLVSPVGRRRIYSNVGIEMACAHLQTASSIAFEQYLKEAVFDPLGLDHLQLSGSAASELHCSVRDLIVFGRELLNPTLISRTTLELATQPVFEHLDGLVPGFGVQRPCVWGLGFEIKGSKDPHWMPTSASARCFGHFGKYGSFLWVDPSVEIVTASVSTEVFGSWAQRGWPAVNEQIWQHFSR